MLKRDPLFNLFSAIEKNNIQELEKLLENVSNVDVPRKNKEYTLLIYAAIKGNKDAIKLLLKKGADINCLSSGHQSIFLIISDTRTYPQLGNKKEIAQILLEYPEASKKPNWFYKFYYNKAIKKAESCGQFEIKKLLENFLKNKELENIKAAEKVFSDGFFSTSNKKNILNTIAKNSIFEPKLIGQIFKFLRPEIVSEESPTRDSKQKSNCSF